MESLKILTYSENHFECWNEFVKSSTNGIFFHRRDFLSYHSERFLDHSLIICDETESNIIAILPANIDLEKQILVSHSGLTFGGLIISRKSSFKHISESLHLIADHASQIGLKQLIYKPIPFIYSKQCAQEDIYCMHQLGASLQYVTLSSSINLKHPLPMSKGKRYSIKVSKKSSVVVSESCDFAPFWDLLQKVLSTRHAATPTHSLSEILLLSERFPDNIKLYLAHSDDQLLSGVVIFLMNNVVHTQYIASSDLGRKHGGVESIIDLLLSKYSTQYEWLDFGISTEDNGRMINYGLINQKEMFGARGVAHHVLSLNL